ncbi:hypothetical protein [uncultured Methylobacterium sp.]|uniref:hypothetical protein n=1 Tax=uncultured Methylobacterium sp. TaxID=157278 RepID=UPI00262C5AB7|nr:hypothetical protein [uncultured Methylobacterium sp.]
MDRTAALRRLGEIENHIAEADRHVMAQRFLVERLRMTRQDSHEAERLLRAMQETLAVFHQHRELILATIDQIDGGLA